MCKYIYEAVVTPNNVGGFDAEFPDLGIVTQGCDLYDAAFMAQDLLENHIVYTLQKGAALPAPTVGRVASEGGHVMCIVIECDVDTPQEETMTVAEAADVLDVSEARVRAMIRDGVLGSRKVGRMHMVDAADVMRRFNEPVASGRPKKEAVMA